VGGVTTPSVEGLVAVPGRAVRAAAPAVARQLTVVVKHLGVIGVFAVPAVVLWWHAWDGHLASSLACPCGDSGQQVWFVAWPAYALRHGVNPFFSNYVWAPQGANLLSNASFPLVGIVLAPLTWAAGPIVSTNVALVLAPALSAWGCWFACRRMVGTPGAAWIAGAVFGYSPFVITNATTGHLGLALLVFPPLMLAVAYELVTGHGEPVRLGIALGLLTVAQFFVSPEILGVTAVVGAVGLLACALWAHRQLLSTWRPAGTGAVVACAVALAGLSLPAAFLVLGPRHIVGSPWPGIQIQGNRAVDVVAAGHTGATFRLLQLGGYEGPAGPPPAYLGIPLVVLLVAGTTLAWRRRTTRVVATTGVLALVLSFGDLLWTSGGHLSNIWLPWRALGQLPVLDEIGPQRFSAAVDLLAALVIALGVEAVWLRTAGWRAGAAGRHAPRAAPEGRPLLAAAVIGLLCAAALVPVFGAYHAPLTTTAVTEPAWLQAIDPADGARPVVLFYPFPMSATGFSQPMVWQSMSAMSFGIAGGYVKVPGPGDRPLALGAPGSADRILADLSDLGAGPVPTPTAADLLTLRAALVSWGVSDIAVTDSGPAAAFAANVFTAVLGRGPAPASGMWVWTLPTPGLGAGGAAGAPWAGNAQEALTRCRAVAGPVAEEWSKVPVVSRCITSQEAL